jgi:hypothetical protein
VAVGGHPRHCDYHRSLVELLHQFFQGAVVALILQELPKPLMFCFKGGLPNEGMHVLDRVSRLFYTCGPTDRLVKTLPSKPIEGGGSRASPPLGFNSLFLNQPLPWRVLHPTFWILSTTKKCSFSLEICSSSKSTAQLIFTIKN